MRFRIILCFLFLLPLLGIGQSQKGVLKPDFESYRDNELDSIDIAESLAKEMEFQRALPIFEDLMGAHPKDPYLKYMAGICYLEQGDGATDAVRYLEAVARDRPDVLSARVFLGKAYLLNYQFSEAIETLEACLEEDLPDELNKKAERFLNHCKNAKRFSGDPTDNQVENIGGPVNTEGSEYVPVISADEQTLLFTYRGERSTGGRRDHTGKHNAFGIFFEDILVSYKRGGKWDYPEKLGWNINGPDHDACIALSPSGEHLFIYKTTPKDEGDIYVSRSKGKEWSDPVKLKGPVNQKNSWEGSASLSADGKTLYFASNRKGGHGGKDLYTAQLMEDSIWGKIENMGPVINTKYDEDAPFIHPDNQVFFFSSKGHNSMGGYDVFRSDRVKGDWSVPENLGVPVNTPGEDIYFTVPANGSTGYYSSSRKGGHGQQDIYTVKPVYEGEGPRLALALGKVTYNDESVRVKIEVNEVGGGEFGTFNSNASSGEYMVNLPAGKQFEMKFLLEEDGFRDSLTKEVDLREVEEFRKIRNRIRFYGLDRDKDNAIEEVEEEEEEPVAEEPDEPVVDSSKAEPVVENEKEPKKLKRNIDEMNYEDLVANFGGLKKEGLVFKVQVAAYRRPSNYEYDHLKSIGEVEDKKFDDGVTRFTMEQDPPTLGEANDLLEQVKEQGQEDAFITAYLDGQRIYLKELFKRISKEELTSQ